MQNAADAALMMKVNIDSVVNTVQTAAAGVIDAKGSIVLMGSAEFPGTRFSGMVGLKRWSWDRLVVRVNIVAPGTIRMPMYQPELLGPGGRSDGQGAGSEDATTESGTSRGSS
ncbi:hypothetical protein MAP00_008366 [Monascus purpureus]|nr:hypothetical protein MAP00_008366 [Monascus purpureus]